MASEAAKAAMAKAKAGAKKAKKGAKAAEGKSQVKPLDLSDEATQDAILEPTPEKLTIGGRETALYPLPARWARKFIALFVKVMNAAAGTAAPLTIRIGTALENDDALLAEVCRYIARAEHEPGGDVTDEALAARAAEIEETAQFDELAAALDKLCDLCRIAEIIAGPKLKAALAIATR